MPPIILAAPKSRREKSRGKSRGREKSRGSARNLAEKGATRHLPPKHFLANNLASSWDVFLQYNT